MTIHSRIKQRREALGMSMQTLADLVGVSAWQTVQQWEKEGGTAPKRERLAKVASVLQTTPEELLLGTQSTAMAEHISGLTSSLGISLEALRVAKAFDRIRSEEQRSAVLAQMRAFGVWLEKDD